MSKSLCPSAVPVTVAPSRRDLNMLRWAMVGAPIFSTCGKRQYLAIVVAADGRVVGTGYNGAPAGVRHCVDGGCPRLAENSPSGTNYSNCVAVHAEANALMHSNRSERRGGTLLVNGTPCWECGKLIAGSGVGRVVHLADPAYVEWPKVRALLVHAGLEVVTVDPAKL